MVSIGVYHRQFLFFVAVALVAVGLGWLTQNQVSTAAGRPLVVPVGANHLRVDIKVEDQGHVTIADTSVGGVVQFFRTHDELNYLLINQPNTDLSDIDVRLTFPRDVAANQATAKAIVIYNPTVEYDAHWQDSQTLVYHFQNIGPSSLVTLVVDLPKGIILPSLSQRLFGTIRSFPQVIWLTLGLVLPILTLLILGIILSLRLREQWSTRTDNERPLPPSSLPPAVVATLVDGRVSARALAATLLDLARREYIDIGSHDRTFTFTKRRRLLATDEVNDLLPYERALLEKVFSDAPQASAEDVRVRIGSSLFSRKIAEVYLGIYESVTKAGYFTENPSIVQGTYRLAGLILFFIALVGFGFGAVFFNDPPTPLLFWVGMILSSLVVIAVAPHMPAHTPLGLAQRKQWWAFRNYLQSTLPIDYTTQTQGRFLSYLPYAVALGVEVGWGRRFLNSPFHLPEWYTSPSPIARWEDFINDLFPIVGYLAQELAAAREPVLS